MSATGYCNAPWFELNISSAEDSVSACCYYRGVKDAWSDDYRSVDDYWNSPNFKRLRQINSPQREQVPAEEANGCDGCFYYRNRDEFGAYYSQFLDVATDLTPEQEENWQLAIEDYKEHRVQARSTPLRFYVNFGWACNLSCVMCHQVPRRDKLKRQVDADILARWKPQMKRAIDVTVIGGEPFALPQAVKFIRSFIDDPELENVQLTICTNGTVHHKHMGTLHKKRKLILVVSLDTIADEYEKIRIGAQWSRVDENIKMFLRTGRELGFPWRAQSPCLVLKTNIRRLYDFAKWAIDNDVQPGFYDFIDSRGVEHTFETENLVSHPELLDDVPEWRGHFEKTVELLRGSKWSDSGEQLDQLYRRIGENYRQLEQRRAAVRPVLRANHWDTLFAAADRELVGAMHVIVHGPGAAPNEAFTAEPFGGKLVPTHLDDHVATPFVDIVPPPDGKPHDWVLLNLIWGKQPDLEKALPRARHIVQRDGLTTLQPELSTTEGNTAKEYFKIDSDTREVRVVFMASDMEPVALPESIVFEGTGSFCELEQAAS